PPYGRPQLSGEIPVAANHDPAPEHPLTKLGRCRKVVIFMMPRPWQTFERPTSRRFALALLLVGAAALQVACGPKASNTSVIRSVSDVSSLAPHLLDSNHPTGSVIWSLFDSLVRRGPDGADLPRLATSWER